MEYISIAMQPTMLDTYGGEHHESVLRAWHIVAKVKWLLSKGTAPEVITELIALMERIDISVKETQ